MLFLGSTPCMRTTTNVCLTAPLGYLNPFSKIHLCPSTDLGFLLNSKFLTQVRLFMKSKMTAVLIIALLMIAAAPSDSFAQDCDCTFTVSLSAADYQWDAAKKGVKPGDKICFASGTRTGVEFFNIKGTPEKPVILKNMCNGQVTIDAPIAWGNSLSFVNCQYYIVDGSNNPNVQYGIEVRGGQAGINNQQLSSDFEIHHVNVNNTGCSGILAKTDPTCDIKTQRGNFVLRNAIVHDVKISNTGCEGFYFGNSHYDGGKTLVCSGINTVVQEHDMVGVQIYNCQLQDIGNDGIQVGSSKQAVIHHNTVRNVGIKNNLAHQNLIQMGGGTHGAVVYNNLCDTGKGYGLYDSGGGGTYYNNIVVNSLLGAVNLQDVAPDFAPTGFRIFNNTFINCNDFGVLMYSENPDPTQYFNNIVVGQNQANYKYVNYNNPSKNKWVEGNNIRTQDITTVKFANAAGKDYHLLVGAPGIDGGKDVTSFGVTFDADGKARPKGTAFDIGAYEYQPSGPKANAGNDQTLPVGTTSTTLPGSGTTTNGPLTYKWTKKSGPATFTLTNDTQATASLSGLIEGTYVFELRVTDATAAFDFDNVNIVIPPAATNQNPVADAGGNQTITLPTSSIVLKGKGTDNDGTIATYAWVKAGGPTTGSLQAPLNQANVTATGLVAGTYTFRLTVTDNKGATASSQATVTVNPAATNQAPILSLGAAKTIYLPTTSVSLTAVASDPDGTIATYAWSKKSGGAATLGVTNQAGLNITGLALGNYTFRCTVTDNQGGQQTADVDVKVLNANQPPIVDAGPNRTVTLPANTAVLNGTASDNDGTIATYLWSKVSGPSVTIDPPLNTATLNIASLEQGAYVFRLTVTDNSGASAFDEVTVSVSVPTGPANEVPLAIAGGNFSFSLPTNSINLYGSGFDPDGTIVSYSWTKKSGGNATLTNANKPTVSISGLEAGQYEFRLVVTDDKGATDDDIAVVTVSSAGTNIFPVAFAGFDKIVRLPQNSVILEGSGTDDDGLIQSYAWTKVSGTGSTIVSPASATTSINGLTEGEFRYRLTVTDDKGASDVNDVVVRVVSSTANIPPVANAGPDKTIFLPQTTLTLTASASDDGTITGTNWVQLSGPVATLNNPTELNLSISGLGLGEYTFQLSVTDNSDATVFDIMRVQVLPASFTPPVVDAGPDKEIVLPETAVTLVGTASVSSGSITSTTWTKIIGGNVDMAGANTLDLACSNMEVGTYVFNLKAVDNAGHEVSDAVQVVVLPVPPNKPPFVLAGTNTSITLPTNSVTLNGIATDEDGTVVSYKWTQVAGPVAAAMSNTTTPDLTADELAAGSYIFRLAATDDDGAVGTGDVLVFVDTENNNENKVPVVFAGEDVLINLKDGITEYVFLGNAFDPDGEITKREWSQYAGPSATITANEEQLTVSNIQRGQFGFRYTATDDDGAVASDDVVMSVLGENDEIPKFFSPNNDGQGEVWVFRNPDNYQGCKLSVFSRSGQVVYEASPYQNNWDGTFNGKPLTNGDYYYNLVCDDGKKIAGAVRIIR